MLSGLRLHFEEVKRHTLNNTEFAFTRMNPEPKPGRAEVSQRDEYRAAAASAAVASVIRTVTCREMSTESRKMGYWRIYL